MALIGYARVSKDEQNLDLQIDALKTKGCIKIFTDKLTGTKFDERKQLQEALRYLRPGDTLVVWKLDRLGRSLRHLIDTVTKLQEGGIQFISLTENIDTTTPTGEFTFHIFAALAQFERSLISYRTKAGLASARARGHNGGRRPVSMTTGKPALALKLYDDKSNRIDDICKTLHISRATLFRWVKLRKEQQKAS
jgi:DNA invertase Pin-like site-specific DNA recombinase